MQALDILIINCNFAFRRQDWGAILLIDERFNKSPKYTNGMYALKLRHLRQDAVSFVLESSTRLLI